MSFQVYDYKYSDYSDLIALRQLLKSIIDISASYNENLPLTKEETKQFFIIIEGKVLAFPLGGPQIQSLISFLTTYAKFHNLEVDFSTGLLRRKGE